MSLLLPNQLFESFKNVSFIDKGKFIEAHQQAPVISVRLNPLKPSDAFNEMLGVPWCEYGKYLHERPNFTADPLLHAGCYYVQEASSMFLEYALKKLIHFEETIIALDLCAAPGGKSTLLSSLLNEESLLISNEVIQNRASILTENMTKWGQLNTWVTANDPKHFSPLKNVFDVVLIDAPCSGSGLFRKMPDFVNDWNQDTVHLCSQRQQRILHDIFDAVKDDGIMIYMTCSFCEEENEDIVDYILNEFEVDTCSLKIPEEWGVVETQSTKAKGYGYRFFPHLLRGEGFFLACFRKKNAEHHLPKLTISKNSKYKPEVSNITEYVNIESKVTILQHDNLFLIEGSHAVYAEYFAKHLRLIKKGILCGKLIRTEVIPEHELAMYANTRKDIASVELSLNEAILYLQKENIEINCPHKGWFIVTYKGHNLGWIKNLGNRVNNYYPSNYRILNKNILSA